MHQMHEITLLSISIYEVCDEMFWLCRFNCLSAPVSSNPPLSRQTSGQLPELFALANHDFRTGCIILRMKERGTTTLIFWIATPRLSAPHHHSSSVDLPSRESPSSRTKLITGPSRRASASRSYSLIPQFTCKSPSVSTGPIQRS